MAFDFELVGKIGSMALIRKGDQDIDYNIFSRIGAQLKPGMIWVSSGSVEIGRLDYIKRNGRELAGSVEEVKTDYAAQGQTILMENYRRFIDPKYSVRQVLVEHQHFNDPLKRAHILGLLERAAAQGAIPIVNYNDAVSTEETRNIELSDLKSHGVTPVECIDNDETASVIATWVRARILLIMTSAFGIYRAPDDPSTLVEEISGKDENEVVENIREFQKNCVGASRTGAGGAKAKLEFIIPSVQQGTTVIIGHGSYSISQLVEGTVPRTIVRAR
ncbi:amino acid kinase family protein [Gehongia tenuis]|uniref:Uridylate kinase n=1 Tax=Gehongia tenuis TaxID=2763655 RepID=A0A926HP96_9FIRM|nr:uridylate kinase [Gehongia tenuis]MBC8531439.1 uridylate kinase [Gehongia tenuis]